MEISNKRPLIDVIQARCQQESRRVTRAVTFSMASRRSRTRLRRSMRLASSMLSAIDSAVFSRVPRSDAVDGGYLQQHQQQRQLAQFTAWITAATRMNCISLHELVHNIMRDVAVLE